MEGEKYVSHISSSTTTERKNTQKLQLCCQLLIAHLAFCFISDQSEKLTSLIKSRKYHQPAVQENSSCLSVFFLYWVGFWGLQGVGGEGWRFSSFLRPETHFLCKSEKVKT